MTNQKTSKPVAVLLADVHFSLATLELATEAFMRAVERAFKLQIPLVIAGDLTDGKAIIRGEVANRLIQLFERRVKDFIYVIPGNHDLCNERGKEHALNFLKPYCRVIDSSQYVETLKSWLIPYQSDVEVLRAALKEIPAGSRLIMHQGLSGAAMGHYVQDKTALTPEDVKDFRVISGHYHAAQDIKCGRPRKFAVGLYSYVGNPYTLTFGEAEDPPKGYGILYDNGILERIPLSLRAHQICEIDVRDIKNIDWAFAFALGHNDLIWLKVRGPASELRKLNKKDIGERFLGHSNYKLELIPDVAPTIEHKTTSALTSDRILDSLIDVMPDSVEQRAYLKKLWREIY